MANKLVILDELGETALLLAQLVNRVLAANDRIKYVLTLSQHAREHAAHSTQSDGSLHLEREASGVEDASLDTVVSSTALEAATCCTCLSRLAYTPS
jgi:hypothetical protein